MIFRLLTLNAKWIINVGVILFTIGVFVYTDMRAVNGFKDRCKIDNEIGTFTVEPLDPNVGWQRLPNNLLDIWENKEYGTDFFEFRKALELAAKNHVSFVRYFDEIDSTYYDLYYIGSIPKSNLNAKDITNLDTWQSYFKVVPAITENKVIYQVEYEAALDLSNVKVVKGGEIVRDLRTRRVSVKQNQLQYHKPGYKRTRADISERPSLTCGEARLRWSNIKWKS